MRMTAGYGERRRRPWPLLFAVLLLGSFLLLAYVVASYAVYDPFPPAPACASRRRHQHPSALPAAGVDEAVTDRYAMPAPPRSCSTPATRRSPTRGCAAGGSRARADEPGGDPGPRRGQPAGGSRTCCWRRACSIGRGFGVLLMDLRDHGDSEGDDARFAGGSEEYLDVLGGWDWVRAQGAARRPDRRSRASRSARSARSSPGARSRGCRRCGRTRRRRPWTRASALPRRPAQGSDGATRRSSCRVRSSGRGSSRTTTSRRSTRSTRSPSTAAGTSPSSTARTTGSCPPLCRSSSTTRPWPRAPSPRTPGSSRMPGTPRAIFDDPAGYEQRLVSFFTAALGAP